MISIYNLLKTLKTKLETDLPGEVYNYDENLDDFEVYRIGASREPKQCGIFIYQDTASISSDVQSASVMIQLQLYQVEEATSAKYSDIDKDYIFKIDPKELGFDLLDKIDFDYILNVDERVSYAFIMPTWSVENDDCNIK